MRELIENTLVGNGCDGDFANSVTFQQVACIGWGLVMDTRRDTAIFK